MMLIVVPPKRVDLLLRVVHRCKPVHVQTLFPEATVERLRKLPRFVDTPKVDCSRVRSGHAEIEVQRESDRRDPEGRRRWRAGRRSAAKAWRQQGDVLQVAEQVRRGLGRGREATA